MLLSDIIINKIRTDGPVPFRDFMELALYHPEHGYYMTEREKIGKSGDFYTSPDVTSVFGEMIAKQLEEIWRLMGKKEFTVVEMGAGSGYLSKDVLLYLKKNEELYQELSYFIIEKSPVMQKDQKRMLPEKVQWCSSITELQGMEGCIFSNELVDAFPVHQVVMEDELMEVFVDVDHRDRFVEILMPAGQSLKDYFSELGAALPRGYRTEINLEAVKWMQDAGTSLKRGFVITIDYGYPSSELYQTYRDRGTLMCYYRHTASESPYMHIGDQDITSHVNFSALSHWGRKYGLETCGLTDQVHFLMGLGIEEYLKDLRDKDPKDYLKRMLQVKTLMMQMGETFKILIQKKDIEHSKLSGLR